MWEAPETIQHGWTEEQCLWLFFHLLARLWERIINQRKFLGFLDTLSFRSVSRED